MGKYWDYFKACFNEGYERGKIQQELAKKKKGDNDEKSR